MSDKINRRKVPHRGRRKRKQKKKSSLISNIILIVAVAIFAVSAFQLIRIGKEYLDGRSEYKKVTSLAIKNPKAAPDDEKGKFTVNFEELKTQNPDTVGWIRFFPEPSTINYPVVQGTDNEKYLHKTFTEGENTMGAIFVDVSNKADYTDKNTIVYGHRMKDGSMFRHLSDYDDKAFYDANPNFYIYTPDGRMLTYRIYAAGTVSADDQVYTTKFETNDLFLNYINNVKQTSVIETGVEVKPSDTVMTLSTCTAANDDNRFVVCGVLEKETKME